MALDPRAYIDASNVYESSLEPAYKKENGVFYTDLSLAEKMLLELKVDKSSVVLDPCCGTGVFIYAAKIHGFIHLYGIDKDESAISFCKNNIQSAHFVSTDSIAQEVDTILASINLSKKPDVIIGNPPYVPLTTEITIDANYLFKRRVSDFGNNLFVAALMRALELVKVGGIISYIVPKNFLHVQAYSLFRRELLEDKTIVSIVDLGSYFKNVRGEQVVLTIKNSKAEKNHKIKMKKFSSNRFVLMTSIPQTFFKNEMLIFNCREDYSIYKKLSTSYQTLNDLCKKGYVGRGKSTSYNAVSGKDIRKFGYKNRELPTEGNTLFIQNIYSAEAGIIATFGGKLEASQTITVFTDSDSKMCRYILGILHSRLCNLFLYKYCYNYSKLTMHTDAKYLKKIPLPSRRLQDQYFEQVLILVKELETGDYMEQTWFNSLEKLNQVVYAAYNITKKESDYIDAEMKRIQSKRWIAHGQF
jgi:hypothetical protein